MSSNNESSRSAVVGVVGVALIAHKIPIQMSFDGGCRTPTEAGAGCEVVIGKGRRMVPVEEPMEDRIQIRDYPMGGGHTRNKMEYQGLLAGLQVIIEHIRSTKLRGQDQLIVSISVELSIKGDSELVINQMNGVYEARDDLKHLHDRATTLVSEMERLVDSCQVTFQHVPREQNTVANALANEAMEERRSWYTVTSNTGNYHSYGHS